MSGAIGSTLCKTVAKPMSLEKVRFQRATSHLGGHRFVTERAETFPENSGDACGGPHTANAGANRFPWGAPRDGVEGWVGIASIRLLCQGL